MTLFSKEHYEVIEMFEKEFQGNRFDKEPKDIWSRGHIYQDGMVNMLFLAYRKGFAMGRVA